MYVWGVLRMWIATFGKDVTEDDFRNGIAGSLIISQLGVLHLNHKRMRNFQGVRRLASAHTDRGTASSSSSNRSNTVDLRRTYAVWLYKLEYVLIPTADGPGAEELRQRAQAITKEGTDEQARFTQVLTLLRQVSVITYEDLHPPVLLPHLVPHVDTGDAAASSEQLDKNKVLIPAALCLGCGMLVVCSCLGIFAGMKWRSLKREQEAGHRKAFEPVFPEGGDAAFSNQGLKVWVFNGNDPQFLKPVLDDHPLPPLYGSPTFQKPKKGPKTEDENKHVHFSGGVDYAADGGVGEFGDVEMLHRSPAPVPFLGALAKGQQTKSHGDHGEGAEDLFWSNDPQHDFRSPTWQSPKPDAMLMEEDFQEDPKILAMRRPPGGTPTDSVALDVDEAKTEPTREQRSKLPDAPVQADVDDALLNDPPETTDKASMSLPAEKWLTPASMPKRELTCDEGSIVEDLAQEEGARL